METFKNLEMVEFYKLYNWWISRHLVGVVKTKTLVFHRAEQALLCALGLSTPPESLLVLQHGHKCLGLGLLHMYYHLGNLSGYYLLPSKHCFTICILFAIGISLVKRRRGGYSPPYNLLLVNTIDYDYACFLKTYSRHSQGSIQLPLV